MDTKFRFSYLLRSKFFYPERESVYDLYDGDEIELHLQAFNPNTGEYFYEKLLPKYRFIIYSGKLTAKVNPEWKDLGEPFSRPKFKIQHNSSVNVVSIYDRDVQKGRPLFQFRALEKVPIPLGVPEIANILRDAFTIPILSKNLLASVYLPDVVSNRFYRAAMVPNANYLLIHYRGIYYILTRERELVLYDGDKITLYFVYRERNKEILKNLFIVLQKKEGDSVIHLTRATVKCEMTIKKEHKSFSTISILDKEKNLLYPLFRYCVRM